MVDIHGFYDFLQMQYVLSFSKYLASVTHYRSIGVSTQKFAIVYPLASFAVFYLAQISGNIFFNLCMGEPLFQIFGDIKGLIINLIFWSLTFHCPNDLFFKLFGSSKIGSALSILREVERVLSIKTLANSVMMKENASPYAAFIIATVTTNLPYHLVYYFDQLIRGVTIKKHEIMSPSFTTKLTTMDSFLFCWHMLLSQISGKYAIIDIIAKIPPTRYLQFVIVFAVSMKICSIFEHDYLYFDDLLFLAPLMKISKLFKRSSSTAASKSKSRRSTSSRREDDDSIADDNEMTTVVDSDSEANTPSPKKKKALRSKRSTSTTRSRK